MSYKVVAQFYYIMVVVTHRGDRGHLSSVIYHLSEESLVTVYSQKITTTNNDNDEKRATSYENNKHQLFAFCIQS